MNQKCQPHFSEQMKSQWVTRLGIIRIIWEPSTSVPNFCANFCDLVDVDQFGRISEKFDLLTWCEMKSHGINKVIRIHPLGTMNVCTKVNGKSSDSCLDTKWCQCSKKLDFTKYLKQVWIGDRLKCWHEVSILIDRASVIQVWHKPSSTPVLYSDCGFACFG